MVMIMMKKRIKRMVKKLEGVVFRGRELFMAVMAALAAGYMMYPATASAAGGGAGGGSYTTAITNLKTVLLTITTPVGAVLLVWGIIRFAISFQKMDQNGEHQAIYTVVAGGVLLGGSAVVAALS